MWINQLFGKIFLLEFIQIWQISWKITFWWIQVKCKKCRLETVASLVGSVISYHKVEQPSKFNEFKPAILNLLVLVYKSIIVSKFSIWYKTWTRQKSRFLCILHFVSFKFRPAVSSWWQWKTLLDRNGHPIGSKCFHSGYFHSNFSLSRLDSAKF